MRTRRTDAHVPYKFELLRGTKSAYADDEANVAKSRNKEVEWVLSAVCKVLYTYETRSSKQSANRITIKIDVECFLCSHHPQSSSV